MKGLPIFIYKRKDKMVTKKKDNYKYNSYDNYDDYLDHSDVYICNYNDYLDNNYIKPLRWHDCRTYLQGKNVHIVNGQQYACTSRKCTSKHCIIYQTQVEANIRKVNHYFLKPDYFITLKLHKIFFALDSVQTSCLMKCFKKKLKDDSKSKNFEFKYEFSIEFDYCKKPHIHGIIKNYGNNGKQEIESEFQCFLNDVWNGSIAKFRKIYEKDNKDDVEKLDKFDGAFGSVYCKKIISVKGSAIYLSKGEKYIYKHIPVPEDFNTSKCHIISRSRNFLVKPKKELLKIYYQNKKFFWEWQSGPLKDKQDDEILLAMGSDIKEPTVESDINDTPVVSDFNDEPTACEAKETATEDSFKEESVEYAFNDEPITIAANDCIVNKPSSRTWVSKVLLKAVWGFALVGSLVFVVSKIQSLPEKPHYSVDLKSDQNKRAKFMLRWFLDNGFEYHQNE